MKEHILAAFRMTSKTYWERFKTCSRQGSESYSLFTNGLRDIFKYYFESKDVHDFDNLVEDMLFQQFMESLNKAPLVKRFVIERNPSDLKSACEFADLCFEVGQNRQNSNDHSFMGGARGTQSNPVQREQVSRTNLPPAGRGQFRNGYQNQGQNRTQVQGQQSGNFKVMQCYVCGGPHPTRDHRGGPRPQYSALAKDVTHLENEFVVPTWVNGRAVTAVRDTGTNVTLVNSGFVHEKDYTGDQISIRGIFGKGKTVKMARIRLTAPKLGADKAHEIVVGAVPNLRPQVLLGNNLFRGVTVFRDIINVHQTSEQAGGKASDMSLKGAVNEIAHMETESPVWSQKSRSVNDSVSNNCLDLADSARAQFSSSISEANDRDMTVPHGRLDTDRETVAAAGAADDAAWVSMGVQLASSQKTSQNTDIRHQMRNLDDWRRLMKAC